MVRLLCRMSMGMRYRMSTSKTLIFGGVPLFVFVSVGVGTVKQWTADAGTRAGTTHDAVTGKASDVANWTPLRAAGDGFSSIAGFLGDNPKLTAVLLGTIAFFALVSFLSSKVEHNVIKDPQRAYTKAQRTQGMDRCGGRCEGESFLWFRCRRPAEHGDHFFPWSLGGATDMANLQMLCAPMNLKKSANVPTLGEKIRLERRRRKYFPADQQIEVGNHVPTAPPRAIPPTY